MAKGDVSLGRSGRCWMAYYYDVNGRRRGKKMGLIKGHPGNKGKKTISERQARILRDRFAVELRLNPVKSQATPKLGNYIKQYLAGRSPSRSYKRFRH